MSNSWSDIKTVFWNAAKLCLKDIITTEPDKWIRKMYPTGGSPDWTINDNVVFLNANIRDDEYGKQRDSIYKTQQGTVMRHAARTRVWDLRVIAYGPDAFAMTQAVKDGVFLPEVQMLLTRKNIFLVPLMPAPMQSPELFAGQWWNRWDITLTFNEKYVSVEDVGAIESVHIRAEALR